MIASIINAKEPFRIIRISQSNVKINYGIKYPTCSDPLIDFLPRLFPNGGVVLGPPKGSMVPP